MFDLTNMLLLLALSSLRFFFGFAVFRRTCGCWRRQIYRAIIHWATPVPRQRKSKRKDPRKTLWVRKEFSSGIFRLFRGGGSGEGGDGNGTGNGNGDGGGGQIGGGVTGGTSDGKDDHPRWVQRTWSELDDEADESEDFESALSFALRTGQV